MINHLLIHKATITDVKRTAGTGGAWPESRVTRASNVPCRRAPATATEQQMAMHRGALVTHHVWFQPSQVVELDDEVMIGETTYVVRLPAVSPSIPIYKKVLVEERVDGA